MCLMYTHCHACHTDAHRKMTHTGDEITLPSDTRPLGSRGFEMCMNFIRHRPVTFRGEEHKKNGNR